MNIMEYIRNIISSIIKVKVEQYYTGIVYYSRLYLLIDDTLMFIFDLSDKIPSNIVFTITNQTITFDNPVCDINILKTMESKINYYVQFSDKSTAYFSNDNLRNDPIFEEMIQQKASDGISFYLVDKYGKKQMVPITKSIFTLNKGDTISGYINVINHETDLCTFHITRKKSKISYDVLFRILSIYQ